MKTKPFVITPRIAETLSKLVNSESIPIQTGYKLFGILKKIEQIQAQAESHRIALVKKYANKDELGEVIAEDGKAKLEPEAEAKFSTEFSGYLNSQTLDIDQLTIGELGNSISMKPSELFPLIGFIIKDEYDDCNGSSGSSASGNQAQQDSVVSDQQAVS